MRIYCDANALPDGFVGETSSVILQTGPTPAIGTNTPINGKFIIDVPDGAPPPVIDPSTRILNPSVPGLLPVMYNSFLALYPQYSHIVYNNLLTSNDMSGIDLSATITISATPRSCRAQIGRAAGRSGTVPGGIVVSPINAATGAPGVLITNTIDISGFTGGTANYLVYWKVYSVNTTDDVMNYSNGHNQPAIKSAVEIDQNSITTYLSDDDGVTYTAVGRLKSVTLGAPGNHLRLAFVNSTSQKVYITAFAVMF